jgi:DNA gyrase subunit B
MIDIRHYILENDPIKDTYKFNGVPIQVEWKKGQTRQYPGSPWKNKFGYDYGYIPKTNCFTKDTKISLLNGEEKTLYDLEQDYKLGVENWVYTISDSKKIIPQKIQWVGKTKENLEMVRVTLDNNEIIVCTVDHRFKLRSGVYLPISECKVGYSLMPLYRRLSSKRSYKNNNKGYEELFDIESQKWVLTHKLVRDLYLNFNGFQVIHHKDYNSRNNYPKNLIPMKCREHLELHKKRLIELWKDPEYRNKMINISKKSDRTISSQKLKKYWDDPIKKRKASKRAKNRWSNPEYRERGLKHLLNIKNTPEYKNRMTEYYNTIEFKNRQSEVLCNLHKDPDFIRACKESKKKLWGDPDYRNKMSIHLKKQREDPEFRKNRSEGSSKFLKNLWKDPDYRKMKSNSLKEKWKDPEYRKMMSKSISNVSKKPIDKNCPDCGDHFTSIPLYASHRKVCKKKHALFNHKIKSIEFLKERFDGYDIQVTGDNPNFALSAGVFVHNSSDQMELDVGVYNRNGQTDWVGLLSQVDYKTGEFDETKVMLGFPDIQTIKELYTQALSPKMFGGVKVISWNDFVKNYIRGYK